MILAPLRGVTIRSFRETFAHEISAAGFDEAFTPFITANGGFDPLKDRELRPDPSRPAPPLKLTPQFIGKDPAALRFCLQRVKAAGYDTADLNCGCPFPMVRNKGRGSGMLRTPDVLRQMMEVGCEVLGPGKFSVKVRLGIERPDELRTLMPLINAFPLRFLTVHARTAKQMYEGTCDHAAFEQIAAVAQVPLVYNGDAIQAADRPPSAMDLMIGRGFVRQLGMGKDADRRLRRYIDVSAAELFGDNPVLGRIKELTSYWKDLPVWTERWKKIKRAKSVDELRRIIPL